MLLAENQEKMILQPGNYQKVEMSGEMCRKGQEALKTEAGLPQICVLPIAKNPQSFMIILC